MVVLAKPLTLGNVQGKPDIQQAVMSVVQGMDESLPVEGQGKPCPNNEQDCQNGWSGRFWGLFNVQSSMSRAID